MFGLWPFGRTVVKRADAGAGAAIGNVLWFVLCGWWLALVHLITGALLCVTIIGIPLGLANFKLIPVSLLAESPSRAGSRDSTPRDCAHATGESAPA